MQGVVDAPARLKDAGEERALAQLRDPDLDVTALGGDRLRAGAVALGDTVGGALVAARPDRLGGFGLDQLLEHHPH